MRFFPFGRLLYKLSNEYNFTFWGFFVWEKIGFEATMVRTSVYCDVIVVSGDFRRMLGTKPRFLQIV